MSTETDSRKQTVGVGHARLALAGLAVLLIAGISIKPPAGKILPPGEGDVALFATVVSRMQAGQSYYESMGAELRRRGYPTAVVFNWRTPFPLNAAASSPRLVSALFFALGLIAVLGTVALVLKEMPGVLLVALFLQMGVAVSMLKVPQYLLMAEAWAGLLIAASVIAYGSRLGVAGAMLGVLALTVRELAAPYCVVCVVLAFQQARRRELMVWFLGGLTYAAYFGLHWASVEAQLGSSELSHKQSWIQFGGLPFLLRIVGFNGWYDLLPTWSRSVGCVLVIASALAACAPPQLRGAIAAYIVFFSVVGQSFNHYWGLVTAPIFAIASGYGVAAMAQLTWSATRPTNRS